jgi:transcriptional antiterminator RfaH
VDLATERVLRWRWTPGLNRIVSYGDVPIPIPVEVIDLLRVEVERRGAAGHQPLSTFHPGDMVRINRGPFRDMMAIFEGPTTPSMRVQVLLKAMGRATRVRLDAADLEAVSGTAPAAEAGNRPRRSRGRGRLIRQPAG